MGFTHVRSDRICQLLTGNTEMKYLYINLENFGGSDVEFKLKKSEFQARVNDATDLLVANVKKFTKRLNWVNIFIHVNINYFSSTDQCEGPLWDLFREKLIDSICMTYAMTYKDEYIEAN